MEISTKRKSKLEIIMYASAGWFIFLAFAFLAIPAFGQFFGLDQNACRITAGALFMIALLYTLIVPFLFKALEK